MSSTIDIQKEIKTDSPSNLVKNINDIIGFKPDNESIVIITTKMSDNSIVGCTIISTMETYQIIDLVDTKDDSVGIVMCYFTNQKIDKIREIATDLFYRLNEEMHIRDFLYIRGNRWGSFICYDEECCPIRGKVIE